MAKSTKHQPSVKVLWVVERFGLNYDLTNKIAVLADFYARTARCLKLIIFYLIIFTNL